MALAEWLSVTYGDRGVQVHCLCPMGVNTNLLNAGLDADSQSVNVVAAAGSILEPAEVAQEVLAAIQANRFMVLPHPEVAEFRRRKVADIDRWLAGMRRLQAAVPGRMKRGIFLAPFDELADPRLIAELARDAERAGFDGFFLWDHVDYREPVQAILDPWVCMAAIAAATERVLIGPLITPPARRRIHKLARETATLDLLSGGRFVFGAGLGSRQQRRVLEVRRGGRRARRARSCSTTGWPSCSATGTARSCRSPRTAHPDLAGRALAQPPPGAPRGALRRPLPDRPARPRGARGAGAPRCRRRPSTSSSRTPRTDPEPVGAGRRHLVPHRLLEPAARSTTCARRSLPDPEIERLAVPRRDDAADHPLRRTRDHP